MLSIKYLQITYVYLIYMCKHIYIECQSALLFTGGQIVGCLPFPSL